MVLFLELALRHGHMLEVVLHHVLILKPTPLKAKLPPQKAPLLSPSLRHTIPLSLPSPPLSCHLHLLRHRHLNLPLTHRRALWRKTPLAPQTSHIHQLRAADLLDHHALETLQRGTRMERARTCRVSLRW